MAAGRIAWEPHCVLEAGSFSMLRPGTERDALEAARRCRSAAERGQLRAQLRLARANERILKYGEADRWRKQAGEAGLSDRRLEAVRARRVEGIKRLKPSPTPLDRLSSGAKAGNRADAVSLLAVLATNGRNADSKFWWTIVSEDLDA